MPYFFADPSHNVKFVAKHIFSIVNNGKAQICEFTKSDSLKLKKYWGYFIKKNRNKSLETFR